MNKRLNYIILIGFAVFLAVNTGISFFIYNQNKQQPTSEQIPQNSRVIKLQSIMQKQFEIENRTLVINALLTDSLKKYNRDNTVLILYLDKYSCSLCVDNAIADLLSFKDSIDSQNILIILSTENKKDAILLKNKIRNQFNILSVKEEDIKYEGISDNLPIHFFIVDNSLKSFCVYFYAPEFPGLNKSYLNTVYQRFFKKEIGEQISNKPHVTIVEPEQTDIELKDLHIGKTSEAVFSLKNTGTQPLVIQAVNASCGCTIPEWDKQPVTTGKSAQIKVRITPEEKGRFNKTVTVHCNTKEGQILLKINGTSRINQINSKYF
jgi:hypothetical protein